LEIDASPELRGDFHANDCADCPTAARIWRRSGYYGYRRWGTGGGIGIFGLVLIVLVLIYVFGGLRLP
jgi:hypothetical protein